MNSSAYFRNLLSLLNMRLFYCLGTCPGDFRNEAHDRIVQLAVEPESDSFLPDESELSAYEKLSAQLMQEHQDLLSEASSHGSRPDIERLRDRFSLDQNEFFLLIAILAPWVDERFRQIYKLFQGREEPCMDFLLGLLEPDGVLRYKNSKLLSKSGKLQSFGLVRMSSETKYPGLTAVFCPAAGLLEWLSGVWTDAPYGGRAEWIEEAGLSGRTEPESSSLAAMIIRAEDEDAPVPMVSFYGPDEDLLLQHSEALAGVLSRPVFRLNLDGLDSDGASPLLRMALRDCELNHAVLVLYGLDHWIDSSGVFTSDSDKLFENWNAPVLFLSGRQFEFAPRTAAETRLIMRISVEGLTGRKRFEVWRKLLEGLRLGSTVDDSSLRTLAGQFSLTNAQIRAAVNTALGVAVTGDRDLEMSDLYEGARLSSMHHLSDLAKKLPSRYTIKDLVLPEKQKQEIDELIAMARNRSQVLDDWGVGKKLVSGRGISALFTGVPGTGKTLSAQVIAGELGLDLYRVDLSTVVSKYIGETEKNLERIFTEAQSSNVILFFDEADSLFGRRSEVSDSHDRYANIEVGYLLQRIETYDGIVLMATNLGANLDEAFARRINYIIDFPFPDDETRLRLWQLLLPDNIAKDEDIDLVPFAASYKIAGGNIRNAVVWAIYDSARNNRPLSADDLQRGVEREYRKMGKVFIPFR